MLAEEQATGRDWAEDELGKVMLGDARLTSRLVTLARTLARRPAMSLPESLPNWGDLKAAYRFFDNAKAIPTAILGGHVSATWVRAREEPVVLAVQDTTEIDFTMHRATRGLGQVGNRLGRGIVCHSTLAVTPERLPLGLLAQRNWVRDEQAQALLPSHKKRSIENKESRKWLDSIDAVALASQAAPNALFVSVGDREADVYELFVKARPSGVELLVRAAWNRTVVGEHQYLWPTLSAQPVLGEVSVTLPRNPSGAAREVALAIRCAKVRLRAPQARRRHLPEIELWAVLATEQLPPQDQPPIEWMLLSTLMTETFDEAVERVHWYTCRWSIEVWHRVLKTGCRIESRQLETVERLHVALTVYSIIAWRILYATMLARAAPNLPCTVLLSEVEWRALYCRTHQIATPPSNQPSLSDAVLWIARLGGFLARKGDGHPGPHALWRGLQNLTQITEMFLIMRKNE